MAKIVIGLSGEKGSGKETFGEILIKLLPNKKIVRVRSSDILRETLSAWDIEPTRHNLQHLAIVMDQGFGAGTVSHAVKIRMEKIDADIIIFDGVRWQTDVDVIRSFANNLFVYITSDIKTRFERIKNRAEKSDENDVSWEKFLKEEKAKTETSIKKISKQADVKIENNESKSELSKKISPVSIMTKALAQKEIISK